MTDTMIHVGDARVPISGILDITDNHATVRVDGYQAGPHDIHVTNRLIREYGLRRGDIVGGVAGDRRDGTKLAPLLRVDTVNGLAPEQAKLRPHFEDLVPIYPNQRLRLETEPHELTTRVADLVSPIGKGQRALVVAPPKAGKTSVLQAFAHGIAKNHPECQLLLVLVGERPEEVTDLSRASPPMWPPPPSISPRASRSPSPNWPSSMPSAWSKWAATWWCCSIH